MKIGIRNFELENRFREIENKVDAMSFLSIVNFFILIIFVVTNWK